MLSIGRSYFEGTVTITDSTTCTLSGGTWPSTAADQRIEVNGGSPLTVTTRTSDTVLVIGSGASGSGVNYVIQPWSDQEILDINDIMKSGMNQFFTPPPMPGERHSHQWTFLQPLTSITTSASYGTGTITISSGVVTLIGGTFPTWAADGELEVAGITYEVNTRGSGTQVTLVDTTLSISTASNYEIGRPAYDLPDDWAMMDGPITYRPGSAVLWPPDGIEVVSEYQLRVLKQKSDTYSRPSHAAVRPKSFSGSTGQRHEILFWPTPDDAYKLYYRYKVSPDLITSTNKYLRGGQPHAETLRESCLSTAEAQMFGTKGLHYERFVTCLMASISHDKTLTAERLGVDRDGSDSYFDYSDVHNASAQKVTYTGHTI